MLDEWRGAPIEPGGQQPDVDEWESVDVPGSPDTFAGAEAVAYRSTFSDPRSDQEAYARLILRGVYAHARVWLNETLLGEHNAYFEPLSFQLGEALEAENQLTVECRRPDDRFGGIYETDAVPAEDSVPGIWWGADINTFDDHRILDLTARPNLDSDGTSFIVETSVFAGSDLDDRLTFSVKPEGERRGRGMMNRAPVRADAGEQTTVEHEIDIRDPVLWWPQDLGEQNRYVITVKLGDDERMITTGLRSVSRDSDGLYVNDRPITVRGVSGLPSRPDDVRRASELNANLVRARASVLPPEVYDVADEEGVLLWQDLPLTGPGTFDTKRGSDLLSRMVELYDHHPSLVAISVHDSPVTLTDGPLGPGLLDRWRLRWRMWRASYDRTQAQAVADSIPDSFLSIPVVGPPGIDADATSLYPGWKYGWPSDISRLLDRYEKIGDIVGAYGAGAIGVEQPENLEGFDLQTHDYHVSGDTEASQQNQRDVLKTVTEGLRLAGSTALVVEGLRDRYDAGMGVFGPDGEPKLARDALAKAFEPVLAILDTPQHGCESDVVVVNDTPDPIKGELSYERTDESGEKQISVEGASQSTVDTISIPIDANSINLSLTLSDRTVENEYRL